MASASTRSAALAPESLSSSPRSPEASNHRHQTRPAPPKRMKTGGQPTFWMRKGETRSPRMEPTLRPPKVSAVARLRSSGGNVLAMMLMVIVEIS